MAGNFDAKEMSLDEIIAASRHNKRTGSAMSKQKSIKSNNKFIRT